MSDLLLEIGCENLPPTSIRPAFEQLKKDARMRLDELRLPFDDIYTTGSPRRLVLIVRGLARRQTDRTETVTGPPVSKGFDEKGKPTRAAIGFAKSHGIAVARLERIRSERGEYLGFEQRLESQRASVLMKRALPEMIKAIRFPKMMRWQNTPGNSAQSATDFEDVRFARPIRWLVCLLGDSVIRFELAGVKTGRVTYTVPWIRRVGVPVKNVQHYLSEIAKAGVLLDHENRYKTIATHARRTARGAKLKLVEDPALFDELTFMLEEPRPLVGEFDRRYLRLPAEVVVTAMKSHQRYLAFRGPRGDLVPMFLTFTEGKVGSPATVRKGNEKVLRARLEDALFYWHEDLKTGLEGLSKGLASVVFIEGFGTLRDKADRVYQLATGVNQTGDTEAPVADGAIRRAALLAKADLASEMVKDGNAYAIGCAARGGRSAGHNHRLFSGRLCANGVSGSLCPEAAGQRIDPDTGIATVGSRRRPVAPGHRRVCRLRPRRWVGSRLGAGARR
jgi:glycyl-tRNA synthetase beta chain